MGNDGDDRVKGSWKSEGGGGKVCFKKGGRWWVGVGWGSRGDGGNGCGVVREW